MEAAKARSEGPHGLVADDRRRGRPVGQAHYQRLRGSAGLDVFDVHLQRGQQNTGRKSDWQGVQGRVEKPGRACGAAPPSMRLTLTCKRSSAWQHQRGARPTPVCCEEGFPTQNTPHSAAPKSCTRGVAPAGSLKVRLPPVPLPVQGARGTTSTRQPQQQYVKSLHVPARALSLRRARPARRRACRRTCLQRSGPCGRRRRPAGGCRRVHSKQAVHE